MKFLVAVDSFKGSVSSSEINTAIAKSVSRLNDSIQVTTVAVSDGGEGAMEAISSVIPSKICYVETLDLVGHKVKMKYLEFVRDNQRHAFIESANILGLDLIIPSEKKVLETNSRGLGIALKKIAVLGYDKIIVTLGGTGVSDGGLGILEEFGVVVKYKNKKSRQNNNSLVDCLDMDVSKIKRFPKDKLLIATDVTNTYFGLEGAFHGFSAQKGANDKQIEILDKNARQMNDIFKKELKIDLSKLSGAGAAGGIGGALMLLNGQGVSGFDLIASLIELEYKIKESDVVITGEGRMDKQSLYGKVPLEIAKLSRKYNKIVLGLCGSKQLSINEAKYFDGLFSIQREPTSLDNAMNKEYTLKNIEEITTNLVQVIINIRNRRRQ